MQHDSSGSCCSSCGLLCPQSRFICWQVLWAGQGHGQGKGKQKAESSADAAAHLPQGDLLGDVALAVARELGALAAVRVPRVQPPLPLPLPAVRVQGMRHSMTTAVCCAGGGIVASMSSRLSRSRSLPGAWPSSRLALRPGPAMGMQRHVQHTCLALLQPAVLGNTARCLHVPNTPKHVRYPLPPSDASLPAALGAGPPFN